MALFDGTVFFVALESVRDMMIDENLADGIGARPPFSTISCICVVQFFVVKIVTYNHLVTPCDST